MKNTFLQKIISAVFISIIFFINGCKRSEIPTAPDPTPTNPVGGPVNDAAQVTASVSGIVLDESNAPIADAVVTSGTATTTTNTNGMFIFQNISLSKENGNVTVVKAGYFKGIRSFKTTAGKNHTVRIQLMQRTLSGTVNAAAGGTITSNGGATIVFPANAFVTSTGAAYTGTVTVYSRWIDPTAANLPFVIPGDLRGVSTAGVENILETYGMVGAELTDATGNLLKIATGKTATVSFPIPASLSAAAPASIVLWHFDDATARWKENGIATKTGSKYTAQVDKFSFWNVDVPNANFIYLDYTLINATTNTPLVSTSTRIKRANGSYGYGITNNAGFVSGLVPKNEALVLEVTATSGCYTIVYTQNIGPYATNTSLGNINITIPPSQYINFSGTLLNCDATPVINGSVFLYVIGGGGAYASANPTTGMFSFSILNCSSINLPYVFQGIDNISTQQSNILTGNASSGTINLGSINVCGVAPNADIYVVGSEDFDIFNTNIVPKIWKNGIASTLSRTNNLENAHANSVLVSGNDVYVVGEENCGNCATVGFGSASYLKLWKNGVATNLTNGTSWAHGASVFVSGSDVYVVGEEISNATGTIAKIWKNGNPITLNSGGSGAPGNVNVAYANSIFVVGNDVYVAGKEKTVALGYYAAKVWKNGIATNLTDGTKDASANSVFVVGNDVYVAGFEHTTINAIQTLRYTKFWKNGVPTNLTDGLKTSSGNSIFVSGSDIYIAGYESILNGNTINKVAKIWKNGVALNLTNGINSDAEASSVSVLGNDVYVTGYEISPLGSKSISKVWKNGVPTNLTDGLKNGSGNSIFVK